MEFFSIGFQNAFYRNCIDALAGLTRRLNANDHQGDGQTGEETTVQLLTTCALARGSP